MVTHEKYAHAPHNAYSGNITDLGAGTTDIRVALMSDSYTPDVTADETWIDISADEIDPASNAEYIGGGQGLGNNALTVSGETTTFDGDNVVWEQSTITAYFAVVYDADSGNLLSVIDFEGEETSEDGDFSIEWDADGIFTVTTNV